MKRHLATYILFFLLIGICVEGAATPVVEISTSVFKTGVSWTSASKKDSRAIIASSQQSGNPVATQQFFTTTSYYFTTSLYGRVIDGRSQEIRMRADGMLFHLFPSHYFW